MSESSPLVGSNSSNNANFIVRFKYAIAFAVAMSLFVVLIIILAATGVFSGGKDYKIMYSSYYTSEWSSPYYPGVFELETDKQWYGAGLSSSIEYQYVSGKHSKTLTLNLRCVSDCDSSDIDSIDFATSIELNNGECKEIYSSHIEGYGTLWQQLCWTNSKCKECPSNIDPPPTENNCYCD